MGERTDRQMADDAPKVAATYFDAWKANDLDTMRSLLADDVMFCDPHARLEGAEECIKRIEGISRIASEIAVRKVFANGPDVLTWYDLQTTVAPAVPVVNWLHVEDGKITSLRVVFDSRWLPPS